MPETHARKHAPGHLNRRINDLLFYTLLLLVLLAPIPFGSNRHWAWSPLALAVAVLTLAWGMNNAWRLRSVSLSLPRSLIILFLIPLVWAVLQASSLLPESWVHPLWAQTSGALGIALPATVSIAPDNSNTAAMRLLSYGLVFFLSFQLCRSRERAEITLKWLAIAAIVYALYGLIAYWGNLNIMFWAEPPARALNATFVNRNSYVTYAGLGLLCLMARSLTGSLRSPHASRSNPMGKQKIIEYYIFSSWKPLLGLMLVTTALIGTQSRGGFVSVAPAVVAMLLLTLSRAKRRRGALMAGTGAVFLILLLGFSSSNAPLLQRLVLVKSQGAERALVYKLTANAIKDSPLTGLGYGTYNEGFRLYRGEDVHYLYDKAHNTYLENVFELGLPAAFSLFASLFGAMLLSLRGVFRRHRDWIYPVTGVAASVLVAVHSLVDFSLQIPAIAFTYAIIMGMAVAQSFSTRKRHRAK